MKIVHIVVKSDFYDGKALGGAAKNKSWHRKLSTAKPGHVKILQQRQQQRSVLCCFVRFAAKICCLLCSAAKVCCLVHFAARVCCLVCVAAKRGGDLDTLFQAQVFYIVVW